MKKIILLLLFALLFAGLIALVFGFYNAAKIRAFAKNSKAIQVRYDFDGKLQELEGFFQQAGSQDTETLQENANNFQNNINALVNLTRDAQSAVSGLNAPRSTKGIKDDLTDFYKKANEQALSLKAVIDFIKSITEVSSVFSKMNDNSTLEDIKNMIDEAKAKGASISPNEMPSGLRDDAQKLVEAYNNYLTAIQEVAVQKNTDPQRLEDVYAEFSRSDNQFFSSARRYFSEMENLNILKNKIDGELEGISRIFFTIK
ncbi:MAG: hypothetical protein WC858_01145 [Parcubacteria group bacterium]|jgi:hypothetical protein